MNKIWQEFYCQGCGGYFRVKLNMSLNLFVKVVCPGPRDAPCGRQHQRVIENGEIKERFANGKDRHSKPHTEEIYVTHADYSKDPWTKHMKKMSKKKGDGSYCDQRRKGVAIAKKDVPKSRVMSPAQMERWAEIAHREKYGD